MEQVQGSEKEGGKMMWDYWLYLIIFACLRSSRGRSEYQ
jgi:hypothetical protein